MCIETFWTRVKIKAKNKSLTIKQLAERCGFKDKVLYTYISANQIPQKNDFVENLANILGTTKEYLLTGNLEKDYIEVNTITDKEFAKIYNVLSANSKRTVIAIAKRFKELEDKLKEN